MEWEYFVARTVMLTTYVDIEWLGDRLVIFIYVNFSMQDGSRLYLEPREAVEQPDDGREHQSCGRCVS